MSKKLYFTRLLDFGATGRLSGTAHLFSQAQVEWDDIIDAIIKFEPLGRLPATPIFVKPCKIAGFLNIGEAGDPSDKLKFC